MPENPRIEELRRRVQADPASIAFAALAEEYRRLGRYDEAIEACAAGLQRHPAYLSARVTLGRALIETGHLDSAREQFETVLRAAPENIAATRGLAQIDERLGHSTQMDPQLAQLMREHVEAAAATAPAPPEPGHVKPVAPPPDAAPVDSPGAQLMHAHAEAAVATARIALDPVPELVTPPALPEPEPLDLRAPVDAPAPAFDFPVVPIASVPYIEPDALAGPDPAVAPAVARLGRFLTAIQHARHA